MPVPVYLLLPGRAVKGVRVRATEGILDEVERNYKDFGNDFFWFSDAIFPVTKSFGHQIARGMIERNLHIKVKWVTRCRVDSMDYELLSQMRRAGLIMVIYGFEVGDENILKSIKPKATLAAA